MQITKTDSTQNKFFIAAPFGNYIRHENAINVKGTYTILPRPGLIKQLIRTLRYDLSKKGWKNECSICEISEYNNKPIVILYIPCVMSSIYPTICKLLSML